MKMITMLVLLLVANVQAQEALQIRTDCQVGGKPSLSVGLMTPELELWAFNLPGFPIYEVGRTNYWQLSESMSVLAGGYLSWWPKVDQFYAEAWSLWRYRDGNLNLSAKVAGYAPLNGGDWWLYSDQCAVTYQITPTIDAGLATDWWMVSGQKTTAGIGAVANFTLSEHARCTVRALKGFGGEADSLRFELTLF